MAKRQCSLQPNVCNVASNKCVYTFQSSDRAKQDCHLFLEQLSSKESFPSCSVQVLACSSSCWATSVCWDILGKVTALKGNTGSWKPSWEPLSRQGQQLLCTWVFQHRYGALQQPGAIPCPWAASGRFLHSHKGFLIRAQPRTFSFTTFWAECVHTYKPWIPVERARPGLALLLSAANK